MEFTMNNALTFAALIPERLRVEGPYSPGLTWFGIWIAALLTFAMYSFLYKDNPVYKFGEHLYVGISVGYYICLTWYNALLPLFFVPLKTDFNYNKILLIPGILGIMMLFRFSRNLTWVSRYPLAFYISMGAGLAIPSIIQAYILQQMHSTFIPLWASGSMKVLSEPAFAELTTGGKIVQYLDLLSPIITFVGVLSVLIYFFFSLQHKGVVGRISQVGIWFLMITFGASFGYTVMARISLLIGRMQFLLGDWLGLKLG